MKTRIYCPDIECESCEKVLTKAFSKMKGVEQVTISSQHIDVMHDAAIKQKSLVAIVQDKGYRAALNPITRTSFGERAREFLTNKEKYAIEYKMLLYVSVTFVLLLLLEYGVLFFLEASRPGVTRVYLPWLVYLTLSVVALGGAIWHFKAYRTTVTCMTGMMLGMTIGMQTGMLIGAVLGATNGFFTGALVGMLLGTSIGALVGMSCGIMGVMEGLMAGIMGGTMGAMITFMMFNDHIMIFMPIYVFLNLLILVGFSYMLFEELVEEKEVDRTPRGFASFILGCFVVLALLTAIVLFAPPSVFLGSI